MLLTIQNPLAPVSYRTKFPRCCHLQPGQCINVATVEKQQWTDRHDISSTVDSAGEFRVAAVATVFQVF